MRRGTPTFILAAPLNLSRNACEKCTPRISMTAPPPYRTRRAILALAASTALATIAPRVTFGLTLEEATTEVRLARNSLDKLQDMVQLDEYAAFRDSLRSGPMGRIRAAGTYLYRTQAEGADRTDAERKYRLLIRNVEAADLEALRESRKEGRGDLVAKMSAIVETFDEFLEACK